MSLCCLKTHIVYVALLSIITMILDCKMIKLSEVISIQRVGGRLKDVLSLKAVENMPLLCSNDVNLFDRNINTIKRNTESLSVATKEIGLQRNAKKTKYDHISTQACRTKSQCKDS
jgi:hypothetical protein